MPLVESPPLYRGLRGAFDSDRFTRKDLQTLRDLGDPQALERLDRCYHLNDGTSLGDFPPQLPRKLALTGRGAGEAHALRLPIEDDIDGGRADGRIVGTELRLRLTEHERCLPRIRCEVNGRRVDLLSARKVSNSLGEEWLAVDDPPLRRGENRVLVVIEGFELPEGYEQKGPKPGAGWPVLHQCELLVRCAD